MSIEHKSIRRFKEMMLESSTNSKSMENQVDLVSFLNLVKLDDEMRWEFWERGLQVKKGSL